MDAEWASAATGAGGVYDDVLVVEGSRCIGVSGYDDGYDSACDVVGGEVRFVLVVLVDASDATEDLAVSSVCVGDGVGDYAASAADGYGSVAGSDVESAAAAGGDVAEYYGVCLWIVAEYGYYDEVYDGENGENCYDVVDDEWCSVSSDGGSGSAAGCSSEGSSGRVSWRNWCVGGGNGCGSGYCGSGWYGVRGSRGGSRVGESGVVADVESGVAGTSCVVSFIKYGLLPAAFVSCPSRSKVQTMCRCCSRVMSMTLANAVVGCRC